MLLKFVSSYRRVKENEPHEYRGYTQMGPKCGHGSFFKLFTGN